MKNSAQNILYNLGQMDTLARQDTPVHRLDPRAKLIVTVLFIICVVSFDRYQISAMIPFMVFPVAMIQFGHLPVGYLLKRIAWVSPFAILLGIFNPLLDREILFRIGDVSFSGGWISFGSILLRFTLAVGAAMILIATTGFDAVCRAMQQLKIPRVFTVQLLFLYRYLFVLTEEAAGLVQARSLRSFGRRGKGIGVFASMAGHLLFRTLDRAERISQAMNCRGFDGQVRLYKELKFSGIDMIFTTGCAVLFLFLRCVNMSAFFGQIMTGQAG